MVEDQPDDFYGIENLPVSSVPTPDRIEFEERPKFTRRRRREDPVDVFSNPTEFVEEKFLKNFDEEKRKNRKSINRTQNEFQSKIYEERFGSKYENESNETVEAQKPNRLSKKLEILLIDENEEDLDSENSHKPLKAKDFIEKMKSEKSLEELKKVQQRDKDGSLTSLHKLWSLIPDVTGMTNDELVQFLLDRVLYNEREIIALDKPYGLPSIPGPSRTRALSNFLEPLRQVLAPDSDRLYLVHRLDRTTTGVILLTTSESRYLEFKDMFRRKEVIKKYLTITRSVPDPPEGIVQIPLGKRDIGSRFKMIPIPTKDQERIDKRVWFDRNGEIREAITEYKTLSTSEKCALVETVIPTGVTHQIRSHLGFGLGCPVLGDHKYTEFLNYKPQRLPTEMLHKLGIRASKSRHLPMYLHAKEIILPEYADGGNLFIRSQVPKFFKYTMKKLRLVFPK